MRHSTSHIPSRCQAAFPAVLWWSLLSWLLLWSPKTGPRSVWPQAMTKVPGMFELVCLQSSAEKAEYPFSRQMWLWEYDLAITPQIWGKWVRGDNCLFQGPPTSVNSYLSPCPLPKPWLGFSSVNRKGYHVKIESEIKLRSKFMGLPMIGHTVWGSFFKNSQLSLEWD